MSQSPTPEDVYKQMATSPTRAAANTTTASTITDTAAGAHEGELHHRHSPPMNTNGGGMEEIPVTSDAANPRTFTRQVSQIDAPIVKTGILGTSSNLVNSIVGAGIIGIPFAIRESGLVVGVLLLVLVAAATDKTLRMIVELASFHPALRNLGVHTFEDLMRIPFGNLGGRFILLSMFVLAYGAMVAYLLIIKDSVPTVLGMGDSFVEREIVMLATSLAIMVPLSMMRDISQLAATSFLSVAADTILVVIVILYAPVKETVSDYGGFGEVLKDFWVNSRIFIGLGVLSTAMACQHSAFLISGTLQDKTASRWAAVTGRSLWAATILSLLLGVFGFLGYLGETKGDVLNNFEAESKAVNAGRTLLAITMFFTYPMESFVARHVIIQLVYNGNMDNTTVGPNGEQIPEQKMLGFLGRRELVTLGLYVMTLIPALIVDDLGPVLSLTGSLGASCIAYIAPGLVYIGVNGADFMQWATGSVRVKNTGGAAPGEVELPVAGDSSANMEVRNDDFSNMGGSKPWWWFPTGMPIWCAIANSGESGTKAFLAELGVPADHAAPASDNEEVVAPSHRDYIISIVFIICGVVAAVLGVASNIYVQANNIFFSPH